MENRTLRPERITDRLRAQHQTILEKLNELEQLGRNLEAGLDVDPAKLSETCSFFREFVEITHEGLEERLLFPALERRHLTREAGALCGFERDHTRERALLPSLVCSAPRELAKAIRCYSGLLRQHIAREEQVLLPLADLALTEEDQASLATACDRVLAGAGLETVTRSFDN